MSNFTSQAPVVRRHQTNTQKNVRTAAILLFNIEQTCCLNRRCIFFQQLLPHNTTLRNGIARDVCETL